MPSAATAPAEDLSQHLSLVKKIAGSIHKILPASYDFGDVVSWGFIGLIQAARSFDPTRGLSFSTHAYKRITGEILDQLRSDDWLPRLTRSRWTALQETIRGLEQHLGRTASHEEIATASELTLEDLHDLINESNYAVVATEDVDPHLLEMYEPVAGDTRDCIQHSHLQSLLDRLNERQRRIVQLYYEEDRSMSEVGALLGITESRVSQLHTEMIDQLKRASRSR